MELVQERVLPECAAVGVRRFHGYEIGSADAPISVYAPMFAPTA